MTNNARSILQSWWRAFLTQWHPKILLLGLLPGLLAMCLWGVLLYFSLNWITDTLQQWFTEHDLFKSSATWLSWVGAVALKTLIVPILAMWGLLPVMALSMLIFIGVIAMPGVARHVGLRHFPHLEKKRGGSVLGSVGVGLASSIQFCLLWLLSLPLCLIPLMALVIHPLLLGWLSYRVMTYDALAEYASIEELRTLRREKRGPLILIGCIAALVGGLPSTILLHGGALALPFLASVAIWLYAWIFIFTGLWFEYYCLQELQHLRTREPV